jgi:hypothetical protein
MFPGPPATGDFPQTQRFEYADHRLRYSGKLMGTCRSGEWSELLLPKASAFRWTRPPRLRRGWWPGSTPLGACVCIALIIAAMVFGARVEAAEPGPRLSIDASAPGWGISPYIYGVNFGPEENIAAYFQELAIPVRRWGGNATTRYNWKLDASNRAADWYFENLPDSDGANLPDSSVFNRFHEQDVATGVDTIVTVPIIGWTPKSRERACGFSVAKYGAQKDTDWQWFPDCGNGIRPNGQNITGNDPHDTSVEIGPEFAAEWISYLKNRYGASSPVRFCELDNEPDCWQWTHRDVFPNPFGYDDVVDRGVTHAAAIRQADPDIQIMGPVIANWMGYFCSAVDWYSGWSTGPNWVWWGNPIDRNAHGGVPLLRYYLRKMREYEEQHGVRILDYLDIHAYPYENGLGGDAGDAAKQARRLAAVRYYWDPTYPVEGGTTEFPGLIPMMRQWIAAEYPGTRLAITEYSFGALNHINGALAQAETLGVFGRERVDLATIWDTPARTDPGAFAFRMYRNYDGHGAAFGERAVPATSEDPDQLSIFAAVRQSDGALTAVVINKSLQELETEVSITGRRLRGTAARVYRYSPSDLTSIVRQPDLFLSDAVVSLVVPAQSITMLECPGPRQIRRPRPEIRH